MITCKEVATAIASDSLAEAGWWTRATVRLHLLMCRHCRRYAEQIHSLGAAARRLLAAETGDADRLERLERSILDRASRSEPKLRHRDESA